MLQTDLVIIGGGQLARMMAAPAEALGLKVRVLAETDGSSAAQVFADTVVGDYRDFGALSAVMIDAGVMTFDHEHVPSEHLEALVESGYRVHPSPDALVFAQDKSLMRARLTALKIDSPPWRVVHSAAEVEAFAASHGGFPVVAKSIRGGYDGKGVWFLDSADLPGSGPFLIEARVAFTRELAVLVARNPSGEVVVYPVVESRQADGMCREVIAPAPSMSTEHMARAQRIAELIATKLSVVGILAVEMFETEPGTFLVNELAMRPHNTGHWTIDGAVTSQFENHLRAVLDLPLGSTQAINSVSVMVNVVGGDASGLDLSKALEVDPSVKVHLYGKEPRPGRKLGHVTVCGDDLDQALQIARRAARSLESSDGRHS